MDETQDDRELVVRAKDGSEEAFNDLVRLYHERIYRIALRIVHDPDEADEITQETFARAVAALDRFDFRAKFYTWIVSIARNAAFDALSPGTVEELLKPENKSKLAKIVTSHAAPGKFPMEQLKDGMQLYMATGHYVPVEVREDGTYVNGAKILGMVEATNGIVYVVGEVFLIAAG